MRLVCLTLTRWLFVRSRAPPLQVPRLAASIGFSFLTYGILFEILGTSPNKMQNNGTLTPKLSAAAGAHHSKWQRGSWNCSGGIFGQTGIVSSALVTPSPSPTTVVSISPAQSLPLTTPTASPGMGRNGFLEASRISTSDVSPAPSPFVTTTSVTAAVAQWVNVTVSELLPERRRR